MITEINHSIQPMLNTEHDFVMQLYTLTHCVLFTSLPGYVISICTTTR